jgi:hypothetical protein
MGGGHVVSTNPQCLGAVFALQPGYSLGAPQPISAITASLLIDGERPIGQRASNRTFTLPIMISGPTRAVVTAAREVLMQMIDLPSWPLIHTRGDRLTSGPGGTAQSTLFQCFRASASQLVYDVRIENQQVATMTITFPALPYGVSNQPILLSFPGSAVGGYSPPTTVHLDDFSSVGSPNTGNGWVRNTTAGSFVTGSGAARLQWNGAGGQYSNYVSTPSSPVDITGRTTLQHWVGFSVSNTYPSYWQYYPSYSYVTVTYILTDNTGRTITFGTGLYTACSSSTIAPNWYQLSVPIPQGQTFDYTHVASIQIKPANYNNGMLYADTWLDGTNAIPTTSQYAPAVGARSAYYTLTGIGSAHAPLAIQAAGPGPRTDVGCSTNSTTTVTDPFASAGDVGKAISGTGIPAGATITAASPGALLLLDPHFLTSVTTPGLADSWVNYGGNTTAVAPTMTMVPGGGQRMVYAGQSADSNAHFFIQQDSTVAFTPGQTATFHVTLSGVCSGGAGPAQVQIIVEAQGVSGYLGEQDTTVSVLTSTPTEYACVYPSLPAGTTFVRILIGAVALYNGAAVNVVAANAVLAAGVPSYTISAAATATASNLTFNLGVLPYSTLLLHTPGQYSPTTFQPVVSLCNASTGLPTDTPDGTTFYSVVSPIAGQAARFAGTYSVVLAGYQWANPTVPRTVNVSVYQYAFAGDTNPVVVPLNARTFTPSTDLPGAGAVPDFITLAEITLPNALLTAENSQAIFKVVITSSQTGDRYYDLVFIDTQGETVLLDIPPSWQSYSNYWIDSPDNLHDMGLVSGSNTDRTVATSVLANCFVSGGPLTIDPGANQLLVYSLQGYPGITGTYFPAWMVDRSS